MNKFFNLLSKELKSLITLQFILPIVFIVVMFSIIGKTMGGAVEDAVKSSDEINLVDFDKTEFTAELITYLNENGFTVDEKNANQFLEKSQGIGGDLIDIDRAELLEKTDSDSLVAIPKGFTNQVKENKEIADVETVSRVKSTATLSNLSSTVSSSVVAVINEYISYSLLTEQGITENDIAYVKNPVSLNEYTVVYDKSENISPDAVLSNISMQGVIIPVCVMLLIMFTSQLIISSISTEKIDKTLETLLSAPVSRSAIIWSKMLSATILAVVSAVAYVYGMNQFTGGITGVANDPSATATATGGVSLGDALQNLGITISVSDYALIGIQMLFTILIALCSSLLLGALVNDTKSAQTIIMPITILTMVPYFISIIVDVNTLPVVGQVLVYAIPFTHTFIALNSIVFGDWTLFFGGLAYQIIFFIAVMIITLKIFKSDKILTMSLNFGQKKKYKKSAPDVE